MVKKRINMNTVAREITLAEGKKKSINIGQVREVLKLFLERLAKETDFVNVIELIDRYK